MQSESYVIKQDICKALLWKTAKPPLGHLDIELTERCNNNCLHCYINLSAGDLEAKKKELTTEEIKRIIKEAVSLSCLSVRFTGGEPLLREDFEELYIFARKIGLKVIIFTNATLINPHLVELFSRIPPLKEIEITIYGMKKSSYEAITGVSGSFEAAWRGINLLLERKIPFMVKGALLPLTKGEIDDFEEWAKIIPWMDKPPSHSMFFDMRCRRDNPKKNLVIKELRFSASEGLKILTRRKEEYVRGMKDFCPKFMRPSGDKIFSCGSSHGSCVDAYGKFQPCIMLRYPDFGYDLRTGSLKDALGIFFPKFRGIKATNPEYIAKCAKCFLHGLCEQCPAKSWAEYGTLDTPVEYLCEIAHTQARFLGLIKAEEKAWEVVDWKDRIKIFTN